MSAKSPDTPDLTQELTERIRQSGPISVADYMNAITQAYYSRENVFGRKGDFITAPEISQTFGELIGLWCAIVWQGMGRPNPCVLAECGPGRGTLMADALRAAQSVPDFLNAAQVHLIEQSVTLKDQQRETLNTHGLIWHETLESCPRTPLILIGNEFLDALPVHQYENTKDGWKERYVDCNPNGGLQFVLGNDNVENPSLAEEADIGVIFETSPAVADFIAGASARILQDGGAALFIDYGYKKTAFGETVQAIKRHKPHPLLEKPGTADITAHVNFEAVANTARSVGAAVHGPIEQGFWLKNLGIGIRGAQLTTGKTQDTVKSIESSIQRLTDPDAMGALFKVIAITHPDLPPPEGFAYGEPHE